MRTAARWALLLAAGLGVFFRFAPGLVEERMNRVLPRASDPTSERARALHRRLMVADLHADSLLWGRDIAVRGSRGHVDVPRLVEGGVALQVFSVVTQVPHAFRLERNDEDALDDVTLLGLVQLWPPRAWASRAERALLQARRLHGAAARSGGRLVLVESARGLSEYLERRRRDAGLTAGLLAVEGAQALDGDLASLDAFWDAGFRMMSLTHLTDNDLGGSAHGARKGGLTPKGRELVRRMEEKGMILDLAHASPALVRDALLLARRPVVVSHTGVRGTCDNVRNLADDQVLAIARTGGVIGIGYWETAVCGADAAAVARAIRHAVGVAGVEHVGLGSDFDGAVEVPFDAAGLAEVTDALLAAGFPEADVEKVMGGNVLRLLAATLP